MELKRVLIQGEAYPVLYDMYGLALIMEESDLDFQGILQMAGRFQEYLKMKGEDVRFLYNVVYAGFVNGSEVEGKQFPLNKRQLSVLVPLNSQTMLDVMSEFHKGMSSLIADQDQKKASEAPKRRATKKKAT